MQVRYNPIARLDRSDRRLVYSARDVILSNAENTCLDERKAAMAITKLGRAEPETINGAVYRSHKAHMVVGLGNYKLNGKTGVERLFEPKNLDKNSRICQDRDRDDGDFHPLQSFAYTMMAGVKPDQELPRIGMTLRTLAVNSTQDISLRSSLGDHDLGHLVFAASHLMPDGNYELVINKEKTKLIELVRRLLEATVSEGEDGVCFRTHAIEGLMAATCTIREAYELRQIVQELVNAQAKWADMVVVGTYKIGQIGWSLDAAKMIGEIVNELGHLIELYSHSRVYGYEFPEDSRRSLDIQLNLLNTSMLSGVEVQIEGHEHLRRGLSMRLALDKALREGRGTKIDLAEYAVDLDQ